MGRDTIQLENAVSTISQEYLLEFTSEYGIPEDLHPELPGPEDTIVDFSEGKVVIGEAKLLTVEIIVSSKKYNSQTVTYSVASSTSPSLELEMDDILATTRKETPQCYTKPIDSLKNWNNRFFWVDERIFPTVMDGA
ncbi:hypothetical protein Tco_0586957 [Tanacetum coccineum]